MLARIVDNQWVMLEQLSPHEEDVLWREFSVVAAKQNFIDPSQMGVWDGVYRFFNRAKGRIARPLLAQLREVCQRHRLPLQTVDDRDPCRYPMLPPERIGADFLPGITLEDYQLRALHALCGDEVGIVNAVTGAGKTEVIAALCKARACPTLILADQTIVIDQIKRRLELRDVAGEVGMFYAGRRPNGQLVVVGSIQSLSPPRQPPEVPERKPDEAQKAWDKRLQRFDVRLAAYKTRRKNAKVLQEIAKRAYMVICDECDKCSSVQYKDFFRYWCKARVRVGFSGTPFAPEKPVENMLIRQHLGSELVKIGRREVEERGRIIKIRHYAMCVTGDPREGSAYDIAFTDNLTESVRFWRMVAAIVRNYPEDGTLILVDKEALGWNLQRQIQDLGIRAEFVFGKTPRKTRTALLRQFEQREYKVLIGGKILDRGVDLAGGCENLIIATGGKLWASLNQKIGRAVRVNSRGEARVFTFFFRTNRYLYNHSRANLSTVVDMGYESTVIFPRGRMESADLIQRRWRIPPRLL